LAFSCSPYGGELHFTKFGGLNLKYLSLPFHSPSVLFPPSSTIRSLWTDGQSSPLNELFIGGRRADPNFRAVVTQPVIPGPKTAVERDLKMTIQIVIWHIMVQICSSYVQFLHHIATRVPANSDTQNADQKPVNGGIRITNYSSLEYKKPGINQGYLPFILFFVAMPEAFSFRTSITVGWLV